MIGRIWILIALTACGRSETSRERPAAPEAPRDANAVTAQPQPYRCFDLPGATRSSLALTPDGSRALYLEGPREQRTLQSLDLATGTATTLARHVDFFPIVPVGNTFATLRLPIKNKSSALYVGERMIVDGTISVGSFASDRRTGTLYFSTRGNTPTTLWKLAPGADTPERVVDGYDPAFVVEDGRAIVATAGPIKAVKVPVGGGAPLTLWDRRLRDLAVVGTNFVFMPDREGVADKPRALMTVPLAGGTPRTLPGATAEMSIIGRFEPLIIVERPGDAATPSHRMLWGSDGVSLARLAELVDVDVVAGVMLPDGVTLAALIAHDTDGDGRADAIDESDVCLVPTTTPAAQAPFAPPTRKMPKRFVGVWPQLEALATKELGARLRFHDEVLWLSVPGDGPATLDALVERLDAVAAQLMPLVQEPRLGLVLEWAANRRLVSRVWDPDRNALATNVGAYDLLISADRKARGSAAWKELADYAATVDRIRTATGYVTETEPSLYPRYEVLALTHEDVRYERSTTAAPASEKPATVRTIWDELAAHQRRMHRGAPLGFVPLAEGGSIVDGTLQP